LENLKTKVGYNSACIRDIADGLASYRGFWGSGNWMVPIKFLCDNPGCHGNEIRRLWRPRRVKDVTLIHFRLRISITLRNKKWINENAAKWDTIVRIYLCKYTAPKVPLNKKKRCYESKQSSASVSVLDYSAPWISWRGVGIFMDSHQSVVAWVYVSMSDKVVGRLMRRRGSAAAEGLVGWNSLRQSNSVRQYRISAFSYDSVVGSTSMTVRRAISSFLVKSNTEHWGLDTTIAWIQKNWRCLEWN